MTKREREFSRKIAALGFTIESITPTSGSHFRFMLTSPAGRTIPLVVPCSPGDWRSEKNSLAWLKRILRDERLKCASK